MRGRLFLPGLIALLLAAFGLLGPGMPARAETAAAAPSAMAADCPMNHDQGAPRRSEGMAAGCPCCCAVAAALPQVASPAPPSVIRLPIPPVRELIGGPGRTIPPALGPPRRA